VRIHLERRGDRAVVRVQDHGIGIAAERQGRIFERFGRAVSPRHYGGLGLGLWTVRAVAEAHGGGVHVVSRPGEGATFEVELAGAADDATQPSASHILSR
jgi:signal transduction histidine kinase